VALGLRDRIEHPQFREELGEWTSGFRHSDTVVVTSDGIEILTDYKSDLESLTLPAD
jgi:hypothetical protein